MSLLIIKDNVVDEAIFKLAHEEVNKGIWEFKNKSHDEDLNYGWTAFSYQEKINKLITEGRFNESNIMFNLWKNVEERFQVKKIYNQKLGRIHFNAGPPLADQTSHKDTYDAYNKDITIVLFLHNEWKIEWGGEFILYDSSHSIITGGAFPMPNRAVAFPSYLYHKGATVSRISPLMRISVAFQCTHDNDI
jgi:Rps23 Pro-64 3,4-dihydroxylase Tpa1-like proline 4-hydroxylase|tara:strand:+ start:986 stop:1558 length:573 start_codon:yes stop_codon:yes gene_type:complete